MLFRSGFGYLHRFGRRSQRFAMDLFHQALAVEPRSARAWAGLALSSFVLYRAGAEEHREEAWQAADRAIELDANSAAAWTARGAALALLGRHEEARAAFERAIAEDESLFEAWFYYGHASIENGRYGRAAELYEHASQLRPDDYQALVFARQAYRSLGDQGRERDAALRQIPIAERALTRNPTDARALSLTAGSLIVVGRTDEALTWSRRACALEPDEPYVHYNAACTLALLGETERALEELEHGTEESVLCRPSWVERDDDLASLRHHPRFRTLLDTLRGPASATDSAKKSVPSVDSPDDTPILNIRPLTN